MDKGNQTRQEMPFEEVTIIEGKRWCFEVHSRSRPGQKHEVDLEAYSWNGMCACENFHFAHGKDLEHGAKPSDDLRCYHILAARSYVMEEIFPKLAKALGGPRMQTAGEGPSPAHRAKEAILSVRDPGLLMQLKQIIDQQIDKLTGRDYEPNPEQSSESNRHPQKIYSLETGRDARRYKG